VHHAGLPSEAVIGHPMMTLSNQSGLSKLGM